MKRGKGRRRAGVEQEGAPGSLFPFSGRSHPLPPLPFHSGHGQNLFPTKALSGGTRLHPVPAQRFRCPI